MFGTLRTIFFYIKKKVFGSTIIIFEQRSLLAFDIAMLALGPLALIFFHHLPSILSKRVSERRSTPTTATVRILASLRYLFTRGGIWRDAWSWGKFWVSFILLVLVELILVCITMKANQNVIFSSLSTHSLTRSEVLTLRLGCIFAWSHHPCVFLNRFLSHTRLGTPHFKNRFHAEIPPTGSCSHAFLWYSG